MRRAARYAMRAGLVAGSMLSALLAWGLLIEPRLIDVEREVGMLPNLPPAWEGRELALIADLQVGMWGANTGTARRIVQRIVDDPPAAVLVAGDFLYKAGDDLAEQIAEAVDIVRPLPAAGIATYAVLGNHDYSMDEKDDQLDTAMAARLRDALEAAGVRVLENAAVRLALPARVDTGGADALYLVGIGSNWAHEDDPVVALAQVPCGAAYVLLMHNPSSFERMSAGAAPLALAAHTHGGQVRVPFTPEWSWLTFVKDEPVHADGWSDGTFGAPGNRLYVNRGIGFSDAPIRINATPELTRLTLRRGAVGRPDVRHAAADRAAADCAAADRAAGQAARPRAARVGGSSADGDRRTGRDTRAERVRALDSARHAPTAPGVDDARLARSAALCTRAPDARRRPSVDRLHVSGCRRISVARLDHAERALGLEHHRLDVRQARQAGGADGSVDLRARDARPATRVREHGAAMRDEHRLRLHHAAHAVGSHRQPRDRELQTDEQRERDHAFRERHVPGQQHRRERRAQRHGDHEVERVHLRERPVARHAQQRDEGNVCRRPDGDRAADRGPVAEPDRVAHRQDPMMDRAARWTWQR